MTTECAKARAQSLCKITEAENLGKPTRYLPKPGSVQVGDGQNCYLLDAKKVGTLLTASGCLASHISTETILLSGDAMCE